MLTNKFKPSNDILKDTNGVIFCGGEEVKRRWVPYGIYLYQTNRNVVLLQHIRVVNDGEELPPLYHRIDVARAIKKLRTNKTQVLMI